MLHCGIFMEGSNTGVATMLYPTFARLLNRFFAPTLSRAARELAYLNGSVSLYDLESREREISRGKFARL